MMNATFREMSCLILLAPLSLQAQQGDTLLIPNREPNEMVRIITGDTLTNGKRADLKRVYVLLRGERYVTSLPLINEGYKLRIVGQPAPQTGIDPGPPVLQHSPDSTGHYDTDRLFVVRGDFELQNVWILAWVSTGAQLWEPILVEQDSARLSVDHCIFEWCQGPAIHAASKWTTVHLTNDLFRNANYTNEWWAGRVIYYTAPADTLVEVNNTVENVGFGLLQSQGIGLNYYLCDHNTVVNCAKFCWLESYYTEAYIANNLLINCHFTGERQQDRPRQDPDLLLYGQALSADTLVVDGKTLAASDPRESGRVLIYANNAVYFDTSSFYPFYRSYNDTVTSTEGKILPEPVMNSRTAFMFTWHTGMKDTGSIEGVNPLVTRMPQNVTEIVRFLRDRYSVHPRNNILWGYDPDSLNDPIAHVSGRELTLVYNNSSRGTYPIPEDLSYASKRIYSGAIGGFAIGDLNWFPDELKKWNLDNDVTHLKMLAPQGGN